MTADTPAGSATPWYKRWWGIALIVLGVLILIGALTGEGEDQADEGAQEQTTEAPEETEAPQTEPAEETEPAATETEAEVAEEPATEAPAEPEPAAEFPDFEPFALRANGDDVQSLDELDGTPAIGIFEHNGSQNFIVEGHTADEDFPQILVNTIGNYEGTRPINFGQTPVEELEIQADGRWRLRVRPINAAPPAEDGQASGEGDAVILVDGGGRTEFTHDGEANFIVEAYDSPDSPFPDIPVNEIGEYEGAVRLSGSARILVIQADGAWTMSQG